MKLRRLASTLMFLLLVGVSTVAAQTVKEVMLDKSGTYIYAQSRNADIDVALKTARTDLLAKIREYCRTKNVPEPADTALEPDGPVKRIDGEALGQHRVFLYIETASIAALPTSASPTPPQPTKAPITPTPPNTPNTPKAPIPEKATEKAPEISLTPAATQPATVPEGRVGELIARLLKQTSSAGVLSTLEKGKSAMILSRYGRQDTKFMRHCHVITVSDGSIHVYAPLDYDGKRLDYSTGESTASPVGTMLFWFIKK